MLARFIGGIHDGLELDGEAIQCYCTVRRLPTPKGIQTFLLMPPTQEDWEQLVAGEIAKDEIEEPWLSYVQICTASGVEFHWDEGGRRLAKASQTAAGQAVSPDVAPPAETTGIYYKCLRGDSENLGLTEPDSFIVHDAKGRDWICYPVNAGDVAMLNLLDHVADVLAADAALRRHGMLEHGTEVRVYFCEDDAELREKLAEELPSGPND
jgi:hypothetical protein